jgi:hypothetical protein
METDLKDKLMQLEAQVAAIKDPALRQIAFGKLLDTIVQTPAPPSRVSLDSKPAPKPANHSRAKSKGKSKVGTFYALSQVRDDVQKLTLSGTVAGLPNFKNCSKGWEKNLWVLTAAKQSGVNGLNNHEIAYVLSKRLYKPTKYSTVNHLGEKVGSGVVCQDPATQCWMITPEGENHLAKLASK